MSQAYRDNNYKSMKKAGRSKKGEKGCGCKNEYMPLMNPNNLKIKKAGK
jgi:hypothetical protein